MTPVHHALEIWKVCYDRAAFGWTVHTDYADPLAGGQRPARPRGRRQRHSLRAVLPTLRPRLPRGCYSWPTPTPPGDREWSFTPTDDEPARLAKATLLAR